MMNNNYFLSGVLYAEDFDLPDKPVVERHEPSLVVEPITLEPTFSLNDLQRAAERALAEGREIERKTAEQAIEARRLDALCQIAEMLRAGKTECSQIATIDATATARAVLAAVAAMLPALATTQALPEVRQLLNLLIPAMESEPKLQIRVNPKLIDGLRNDLERVSAVESITLDWVGVETMAPGDILVKWAGGMMIRDTQSLCSQICELLVPDFHADNKGR